MPVDNNLNIGSLMDIVFFDLYFRGNCNPSNYPGFNTTMLHIIEPVLDPEDVLIWMCVYLGVAACWLLASVVLLTGCYINIYKK